MEQHRVREALKKHPVVVLCATEVEAAPMEAALEAPRGFFAATKRIVVGRLPVDAAAERGAFGRGPELARRTVARRFVGVVLAISGCDKANAAHTLTVLLEAMEPAPLLVLQTGIAGALTGGEAEGQAGMGDLVLATKEIYSDTGSSSPGGWLSAEELGLPVARVSGVELGGVFVFDRGLVEAACAVLGDAVEEAASSAEERVRVLSGRRLVAGPFVTSSRVTGLRLEAEEHRERWDAVAESMEGAAAAHICALYGVPFLEVRGVSNMVGDRDRGSWRIEEAVAAAAAATMVLCRSLHRLPLSSTAPAEA